MTTTGAALAPLVDALLAEPLTELDVPALQAQISAVTPLVARLQGWLTAAAGQLDALSAGTVPDQDGRARTVAGWLADVQHTTPSTTGAQLRTARLLRTMPLVADAVLDGALTPAQAAVLTRPAQLGLWVAHQLATHCEPALDTDETRGQDKRYLTHRRDADGTLRGRFVLSPEDSEVLLTALEPLARNGDDDDHRTAGQRRADALTAIAEQVLRHGTLPDTGGLRPQLSYVLPASWAAAQHQRATCTACGPCCPDHQPLTFADTVTTALPGHGGTRAEQACATAAWSGPQTRPRIEALLCDARTSRVLLDDHGQVTSLQPLRDSITARQRRALAARDLGCTARGCTRPPALCDAHHLIRRTDGGPNTLDDLVLLCRRHHVRWHQGKLQLHHLTVPWHPEQHDRPPHPLDDLFSRAGP